MSALNKGETEILYKIEALLYNILQSGFDPNGKDIRSTRLKLQSIPEARSQLNAIIQMKGYYLEQSRD